MTPNATPQRIAVARPQASPVDMPAKQKPGPRPKRTPRPIRNTQLAHQLIEKGFVMQFAVFGQVIYG